MNAVFAAPRGFPVDGDNLRAVDPRDEAHPEQLRIERRENVAERGMAGEPFFVGEEAPEKGLMWVVPWRPVRNCATM